MKYDRSVKDYVLSSVGIADLVSGKVELKRVGSNMRGLCPFHVEKTPSFYVTESRGTYYCFGCKEHGNAIDFVMQTEGLGFIEALESLADRYSLDLSSYVLQSEENKDFSLMEKTYEMNREAGRYFHSQLMRHKHALEYFEDRKIKLNTVKSFGLGYAGDSWTGLLDHLKSLGYREDEVLQAGLASKSEKGRVYDRFRNRLIFPIFDFRSKVLGFGARSMGSDMPKYLNSPESAVFQKSKILYGDRMSRKAGRGDSVILVEGYMDLLQVYQAGFPNVLASMGTALTPEQVYSISKRYKIVLFAYDMDEAGRNAISRSIPLLENHGIDVRVVDISPAKDPDEFLKKFGKLAFKERLESSENSIRFNLANIKMNYDLRDAKERYKYVLESIELISKLCSSVEAELYLQELAELSSIPYDKILTEYSLQTKGKKEPAKARASAPERALEAEDSSADRDASEPALSLYEKQLIAFSVSNKEFALKVFERTLGEFLTEKYLTAFSILMMYYATNERFDPIQLSEELDLDAAILLQDLFDAAEASFSEQELEFILKRWEGERFKLQIEEMDREIRTLTFLDDEASKIKLRALRKKRSKILKDILDIGK